MATPRKRTITVAAGVSAALLASSTAFAVANGIFGTRPRDKVGQFGMIEQRLVPAELPAKRSASSEKPSEDASTTPTAGAEPAASGPDVTGPPSPPEGSVPSPASAYAPQPEPEPTSQPEVVPPTGSTPTSQSTASSVPHHDDHETETTIPGKDD